ncbi:hypothetical protein HPB47_017471 [Ixodes persulcatus]|uniref:Uncharacterized protein n=1 Tax=Ixodes persulcatus TaxID=34615 RepID=A0AC60R352_IXOPE|nr:hypothetical protein HPB47_017471 [Ixodes persulcatus]
MLQSPGGPIVTALASIHRYKVSTRVDSFQYGNVSKSSSDAKVVYTEWSYNTMPTEPIVVTLKRTKTRTHQYSWQTQDAMSVDGSISIEVGLPKVVGGTASVRKTVSLTNTTGQVETVSQGYTVDVKVTVPPRKKAKIEWVITDVIQEIPWTAQIDIEGWFAVWFRWKVNDHYLWFYPVSRLEDPLLERTQEGVRYTASGIFTDVSGTEGQLRVSEYDIPEWLRVWDFEEVPTNVYTIPLPSPHDRRSSGHGLQDPEARARRLLRPSIRVVPQQKSVIALTLSLAAGRNCLPSHTRETSRQRRRYGYGPATQWYGPDHGPRAGPALVPGSGFTATFMKGPGRVRALH